MTLSLSVADDRLGAYYRKTLAIADRLDKSLDFDKVMAALQRIHDGQLEPVVIPAGVFPVWKTIKRPAGASAAYYRASYKKKGIQIGTYADQILDKVDWSEGPDEVDVARVFVRDLGFKRATRRDTVYEKAFASGVQRLPAWVPPQLRDEYDEQPSGEWLVAGMEPLTDSDGRPGLFSVVRDGDGGRWLSRWGGAVREWDPDDEFLFPVPRK